MIWKPVADDAKKQSDDMYKYLEDLKGQLKAYSGLKKDDKGNPILNEKGEEEYKLDDLNASSRLMDNEKKGKELDDRLKAYKAAMLVNPEVRKHLKLTFL